MRSAPVVPVPTTNGGADLPSGTQSTKMPAVTKKSALAGRVWNLVAAYVAAALGAALFVPKVLRRLGSCALREVLNSTPYSGQSAPITEYFS